MSLVKLEKKQWGDGIEEADKRQDNFEVVRELSAFRKPYLSVWIFYRLHIPDPSSSLLTSLTNGSGLPLSINDISYRNNRHILTPLRDSQPRIPTRSMQRYMLFWRVNSESKILDDGKFGKVVDIEFAWWAFAWLGVEILFDRSILKQKMSSTVQPPLVQSVSTLFFGLGFLVWPGYNSLYY